MNTIELLAPAKDLECGVAAIDCGADAVYIGAPRFGAREAAANALHDIADLANYAHKYWAKVYVTLNTLLRDDEIPEAVRIINELHDIGIDALIIQDVGLLECDLPPIPLIASTQMHNARPEKIAFLEQVGISRAILARELDLDQINTIRSRTAMELEFFVHGALCVCYSGQCYLSYALGGRSGNRGQCAQPCRKEWTLVDGYGRAIVSNKHLLSIRDLNLSEHLRELIDAGICSFKIEGRLKDKAYVTNVVSYYSARLNELGVKRTSSGASRIDFTPDPAKTFNRGYGTHFINGRDEKIGSIDTPKMVGEAVGAVATIGKNAFTLDSDVAIHTGDGICFFDPDGRLRGTMINGVRGKTILSDNLTGIRRGTLIYRNHDHEFLTKLDKARVERRIGVRLALRETPDGLALAAEDEDGNTAEFALACEKTPAEKPERALENIRKQLLKSGGTEFECTGVTLDLSEVYFLPISTLNALRRGALESLASARSKNRPTRTGGAVKNDVPYPEKLLSFSGNVLNHLAESFYRMHGAKVIEYAAESGLDLRGRKVMTTRYCIKHQLDLCPKDNPTARHPEPLCLIDEEGHTLELRFDCDKCQMQVYLAG